MRSPNPLSSVKSVKLTGTVISTDLSSAMLCATPLTLMLLIVLGSPPAASILSTRLLKFPIAVVLPSTVSLVAYLLAASSIAACLAVSMIQFLYFLKNYYFYILLYFLIISFSLLIIISFSISL